MIRVDRRLEAKLDVPLSGPDLAELEGLLAPHHYECDVYYDDTDLTGAVYHANYLRFFGRARMVHLGAMAIRLLQVRFGLSFIVHKTALEYKHPTHFGDRIRIRTETFITSASKLDFKQTAWILGSDRLTTLAETRVVCIDAAGRPARLPIAQLIAIRRTLETEPSATALELGANQGSAP